MNMPVYLRGRTIDNEFGRGRTLPSCLLLACLLLVVFAVFTTSGHADEVRKAVRTAGPTAGPVAGQVAGEPAPEDADADERPKPWTEQLAQLIAAHPGEAAVAVRHFESGETFQHQENEPFPTASLIKLPVMIEAYRQAKAGKVRLTDSVTLRDEDKVPGSGILTTHFSAGASFPLRDAIRMMIAWSDNTATNLVIDQIGLPATTATMKELGCPETRLHAKVFRRETSIAPERSQKYGLGSTTAAEMLSLLERLERRELVDRESSEAMLGHLLACQDQETAPRFLPPRIPVAHKTGAVTGVRTDAGAIRSPGGTILFCVLTRNNRRPERAAGESGAAGRAAPVEEPGAWLCARVAQVTYEHFNPANIGKAAGGGEGEFPTLRAGDSGESVVRLQQALNRSLDPSPELDVDGEFGPQTQAAVVRFQRSRQLAPTGVVDRVTWERLKRAD